MKILMTVIVPVYNVKREYFKVCIDYLTKQTLKEIEIIVVDDGSNEKLASDYQNYCKRDGRIRYIYQENRGVSAARNTAIEKAKGEYLIFVDADDWLEYDTCEQVYAYAKTADLDVVLYGYFSNYVNKELVRVLQNSENIAFEAKKLQLAILQGDAEYQSMELGATLGKAVRRELVVQNDIRYILGLKQGEDALFSMNIYEFAEKIGYLPKALYHYRRLASSASADYQPDITERVKNTLVEYEKFIYKYHDNDVYKKALLKKKRSLLFSEILPMNFFHSSNPHKWKKTKDELREYLAQSDGMKDIYINEACSIGERMKLKLLQKECFEVLKIYYWAMQKLKSVLMQSYE